MRKALLVLVALVLVLGLVKAVAGNRKAIARARADAARLASQRDSLVAEVRDREQVSAWGLTTLPFEDGDTLGLEYLMVPAWFAETFVIDHANAESWRTQKDHLLAVDSLRLVVTALQDSVTRLVAANASAYQSGYQAAYTGYQDLSKRYVAELKEPRIRIGSALGLLGAAGLGMVVGRAIP